jgi:hypothetical protein
LHASRRAGCGCRLPQRAGPRTKEAQMTQTLDSLLDLKSGERHITDEALSGRNVYEAERVLDGFLGAAANDPAGADQRLAPRRLAVRVDLSLCGG